MQSQLYFERQNSFVCMSLDVIIWLSAIMPFYKLLCDFISIVYFNIIVYLLFCHHELLFLVIKAKTMVTKRYTKMNHVIEYLTNGDLSELCGLSEDKIT